MPDLLGATNPVPGHDAAVTNRTLPVSPNNTQIENVPDPGRVTRPDGRTEQQDSSLSADSGRVRYDSNFQTFLQRLRENPDLTQALTRLFAAGQGTVVASGMSAGVAQQMTQILKMLHMDRGQLLNFLTGQARSGTRFGGALFALLRSAYDRAGSDGVRTDILQFLKTYADYASSAHIEKNLLRSLRGMAGSMPASWAGPLGEMSARLENCLAAGDRRAALELLQQQVFPHMSSYVGQTHDIGTARAFLALLTLDMARYENGSEENLLQAFHRLSGYPALKEQLGGIDDRSLLQLLRAGQPQSASSANLYADHLAQAASRALSGEGDAQTQQVFRQLIDAMLINQSVYMPVNHYLVPLEWDGRLLFSELWIDPDADEQKDGQGGGKNTVKVLFKMDVEPLGLFDVVIASRGDEVDLRVSCPDRAAGFSERIGRELSDILVRCGLTPKNVTVARMQKPVTLTEVFPKIFEGKNSVNVKV